MSLTLVISALPPDSCRDTEEVSGWVHQGNGCKSPLQAAGTQGHHPWESWNWNTLSWEQECSKHHSLPPPPWAGHWSKPLPAVWDCQHGDGVWSDEWVGEKDPGAAALGSCQDFHWLTVCTIWHLTFCFSDVLVCSLQLHAETIIRCLFIKPLCLEVLLQMFPVKCIKYLSLYWSFYQLYICTQHGRKLSIRWCVLMLMTHGCSHTYSIILENTGHTSYSYIYIYIYI